jgi:hypothetical protein
MNDDKKFEDEKELDDLFDPGKNTKLKKAVKKARRHTILRNAGISLIVLAILFIGGSIANRSLVYKLEGPVQIAVSDFNQISAPNRYIGKLERYHGFLGGKNSFSTYKILDGKVVYTGKSEYGYGIFQDKYAGWIGTETPMILGRSYDTEDLDMQKYNELGQREMVFFYPYVDYPQYKNDLQQLDQIEPNKVMEVALSFDQAYSMNQVNKMLPDDVTLSWYWIDDLNEEEKKASPSREVEQTDENGRQTTVSTPPLIRSEYTAYGIKAINENNEQIENPLEPFVWALESGKEYNTRYKGEFERVYNNLLGSDSKLTKDDIRVLGAVVTGDAQSLKSLQGLPFINSSSIGAVTDKY